MDDRTRDILQQYDAWEPRTDKDDYRWKLRLLQSHWRCQRGLKQGFSNGKIRGAELAMPEAKETLANYLTRTIRTVVRREVDDEIRSRGKIYTRPRIYNHLLSSQPLSFNLFGELSEDYNLASCVLREMTGCRIRKVTAIEFEWSPGRGDVRYTGDKSAFDVYVRYDGDSGRQGFLGIEFKYHEDLKNMDDRYRPRYDEVAADMRCFREELLCTLRKPGPLQQMWRDHLLVGSHGMVDCFDEACFVFVYPEINTACSRALECYRSCLRECDTFDAWTLDEFVCCLSRHTDAEWVTMFHDRYLNLNRLPH